MTINNKTLHGNGITKPEIMVLADIFAKNIVKGDVILLEGPIGIGKTFFSRAIIRARYLIDNLEAEEVPSPTFSLIQGYKLKYFSILHLDLYRLVKETDLFELGIPDIFDDNVTIVEWADMMKNFQPSRVLSVYLSQSDTHENTRNIKLKFLGKSWDNLYQPLKRFL